MLLSMFLKSISQNGKVLLLLLTSLLSLTFKYIFCPHWPLVIGTYLFTSMATIKSPTQNTNLIWSDF